MVMRNIIHINFNLLALPVSPKDHARGRVGGQEKRGRNSKIFLRERVAKYGYVIGAAANNHVFDFLEIHDFGKNLFGLRMVPFVFDAAGTFFNGGVDDFLYKILTVEILDISEVFSYKSFIDSVRKHYPFEV